MRDHVAPCCLAREEHALDVRVDDPVPGLSSTSSDGPVRLTPALLIRMSSRPPPSTVCSTSDRRRDAWTSVGNRQRRLAGFRGLGPRGSSVSAWRPASATKPPPQQRRELARPIPLPAPVTRTTRSENRRRPVAVMALAHHRRDADIVIFDQPDAVAQARLFTARPAGMLCSSCDGTCQRGEDAMASRTTSSNPIAPRTRRATSSGTARTRRIRNGRRRADRGQLQPQFRGGRRAVGARGRRRVRGRAERHRPSRLLPGCAARSSSRSSSTAAGSASGGCWGCSSEFDVKVSLFGVVRALQRNPEVARAFIERRPRDRQPRLALDRLPRGSTRRPSASMCASPSRAIERAHRARAGRLDDRPARARTRAGCSSRTAASSTTATRSTTSCPTGSTCRARRTSSIPYSLETNDNRFDRNTRVRQRPTISPAT